MRTKTILVLILLSIFNFRTTIMAQKAEETYYIQSAITDKYLDVQWANTTNATPLHLWSYNGKGAQQFKLEDAGDGYFYIKTALAKNTYVHVQNRSNQPKVLAHIWKGKGNDNTKWSFIPASEGYYFIRSKKGTYLDVKASSKKNGTPIWMWTFNGNNNQRWKFKKVPKNSIHKIEPTLQEVSKGKIEFHKETITLKPITNLCPSTLVSGDLEFAGNGPKVFGSVHLYPSENGKELISRIKFNAQETHKDFLTGRSEVKGYWETSVYKAPYGKYINGIVDKPFSETSFSKILKGGGQNELFGGGDGSPHNLTISNGLDNKGHVVLVEIVGDTGGWDISTDNNCRNDTRILKINFSPIEIELIQTQQ